MTLLDITRSYDTSNVLLEADLDNIVDDVEEFLNTTKISDDNIQTGGITASTKLAPASITKSRMATDSVGTSQIEDDAITKAKLADSALYLDYAAKTSSDSPYTVVAADDAISCDCTSGAITVNLPAAASHAGRELILTKIDSSTNIVTIDGNASETINGSTTTTLNTQYESIRLYCDGSNWLISERRIPSVWTAYTPTLSGGTVARASSHTELATWRRVGDSIEISYTYFHTVSTGAVTGTGPYLWTIPNSSSWTVDSNKISISTGDESRGLCGTARFAASDGYTGFAKAYSTTQIAIWGANQSTSGYGGSATNSGLANSANVNYTFRAVVPISGWNG